MAIVTQSPHAGPIEPAASLQSATLTVERRCDERLRHELETACKGVRSTRATSLAATGWAALGLGILALAAIDYQLETTWNLRAALLAIMATTTTVVGVLRWLNWGARFSLTQTAALVEQRQATIGQRLRTTLDYDQGRPSPSPASPALLEALERETTRAVQSIAWSQVVDRRAARYALTAAAVVWGAGLASLAAGPEWRTALARTLLAPLEYTTVEVKPLESTIRAGESVTVEVEITGRPLREATLRFGADATRGSELPLLPPDTSADDRPELLSGKLEATLADLQEDTSFEVSAGPRELPRGFVRVLQPLELTQLTAAVTPPAYTGLPRETLSGRELRVREGSRVELRVEFNRSASLMQLTDVDAAQASHTPLSPAPGANATAFVALLEDVRESRTLELRGNSADGMQLSPATISIRVIMDRKPKLTFVDPPEQLEVLPTTEVPIKVAAQDDLALLKVGVLAQVGDQPLQVLVEQTVDRTQDPVEVLSTLLLENYPLTHQHGVTYHAFAEDDYFGMPRRVTTPLRFIDIRPYQRDFQRKEGGNCSSCNSTTLEELIARQRQNASQTFMLRDQTVRSNDQVRLATNEREIQAATEELTTGLAERGMFIPELPEAVQAMKQATESLEAGDMSAASDQQQTALAKLLHARQNFRKMISECNSQQQSECQKFDQQQRQKLRTPEQKKEEQKQEVAKARKELEQLAQQQRKWSEEVRSQCQNSSSSSSSSQSQAKSQSQSQSQSESKSESKSQPPEDRKSPEQLAQEQQKMLEQLAALRERLEQAGANSEAGREQARQASESMKSGLEQLQQEQGEQAASQSERSAEQLEQLADHLHALQSGDLAGRLDQARQMAEQLARRQSELAKSAGAASTSGVSRNPSESAADKAQTSAGRERLDGTPEQRQAWAQAERDLAQQADLLGERLSALRADASGEKSGMDERLEAVNEEQSPSQLGAALRRAAEDAQAGRAGAAKEGAQQAKSDAERLAKSLGGLRQELTQPQLQELMKLEEQLASLERQLARQRAEGEPSAAGERWSQIAPQLESLAKGDRRLAEAIQRMAQSSSAEHREASGDVLPPGFYGWNELAEFARVNEVTKVVQMKIQEAILAGALQESDEPVPPEFRSLVDEYYRALSDDLSP